MVTAYKSIATNEKRLFKALKRFILRKRKGEVMALTSQQRYYRMRAEGVRQLRKQTTDAAGRADLATQAHIYDLLGELTETEAYKIMDTSIFNDAIKGYLLMVLDHIAKDPEAEETTGATEEAERIRGRAAGALARILDDYSAKDAAAYSDRWSYERGPA